MNQSWRQSKQKSLNCPWLPPLFKLWPLVNYLVYFTISPLRNQYEWERVLDHVWEDGLCKIHSIKCSNLCFCLAPAERKVVPPQLRGLLPPLLWVSGWNNPLYNFLCSTATSTVTFHPNTFTCRTSVWNRGSWNLPLSTPSSCLPQSIPDYRHYYA